MRKEDQKLSEKYQKSSRFEQVLTSLNTTLAEAQREVLQDVGELHPTIHILGAPRSGTTLVSQLLPSFLNVGHINNLIATFWKAPVYGIELSKKLIGTNYKSTFQSDFGRTSGINEPHEFGYFWNHHLKYDSLAQEEADHEDNIDWEGLTYLIRNMLFSYGCPIVFKSFLLGFHARTFHSYLPKTCFIYIKRNLADNVMSILDLRKKLNGDISVWGSIRPLQYNRLKDLDIYEQVVGQIMCLEHEYLQQMRQIPETNTIIFHYEDLCERPAEFLKLVQFKFLNNAASAPDFEISAFESKSRKADAAELGKIDAAREKILTIFPDLISV